MPNSVRHEMEDYHFSQMHRKASESYIEAQQSGQTREEALAACDRADRYGRQAFVLAGNTLQRAGEFSFLQAVYGLRLLIELDYHSVVTRVASEDLDTSPTLTSQDIRDQMERELKHYEHS